MISRFPLATLPTPLMPAPRLTEALRAGPVHLKRDDLTGFGVAGNKARALEALLADARSAGADVLVTGGSASSSFCAAAAMAAAVAGMDCELLLAGKGTGRAPVTVALARAVGARLVLDAAARREDLDAAVEERAAKLAAEGRRPYPVPRGGASPVGATGYALAAGELLAQARELGLAGGTVVVATGSGATQAGLVAGLAGSGWRVVGASVSRPPEEATAQVLGLARACAALVGLPPPAAADVVLHDLRGPGFGVPAEADRDSARVALRSEGLLLDPTYGAKALTLARALLHEGLDQALDEGPAEGHPAPLVLWHTGGVAGALAALDRDGGP